MQARAMRGIDRALHHLRPLARRVHLDDADAGVPRRSPVRRLEFAETFLRPHIDPDDAAAFADGIGFVLALELEPAGFRFAGRVENIAVHVEFPAVVEAAQPRFLVAAEGERSAAVRTMLA